MKDTHFKYETEANANNTQQEISNENIECFSNDLTADVDLEYSLPDLNSNEAASSAKESSTKSSESTLNDVLKKLTDSALKLVLSLFSKNNMNRKDVFDIIAFVKDFIISEIVSSIKSMVLPFIDVKHQIVLLNLMFNVTNMFKDTDSEFKLFSLLESLNLLFPVQEVTFSKEIQPIHSRGEINLSILRSKGVIYPLKFSIKSFFDNGNLVETSLNQINYLLAKDTLENFVQESLWRKKIETFPREQQIIPYFLYLDDLLINNALGSHTSSVCAFYISFPTIPNCHKLENILIASLIESSDIKTFGNHICMKDLIKSLIQLEEEGIDFTVNGKNINVRFVLALVLGDNLALNSVLECNKSFNAHSYCRLCKTKKNIAEYQCDEIIQNMRTKENYLLDIEQNNSQDTGLKGETIFNEIPSFHFTDNLTVDIMHDLFEGVFIYDICKSILLLIEQNKSVNLKDNEKFSLFTLNLRKNISIMGP